MKFRFLKVTHKTLHNVGSAYVAGLTTYCFPTALKTTIILFYFLS